LARRVLEAGVRVRAYGWRKNRPWQTKGTIIGTDVSGIGEAIFIVVSDVPETDGGCVFDLTASDLARLPVSSQKDDGASRRRK
jgi:hypothetical protein